MREEKEVKSGKGEEENRLKVKRRKGEFDPALQQKNLEKKVYEHSK